MLSRDCRSAWVWESDIPLSDVAITLKIIDVRVVVRMERMQDTKPALKFVLATIAALTECTQIVITPAQNMLFPG